MIRIVLLKAFWRNNFKSQHVLLTKINTDEVKRVSNFENELPIVTKFKKSGKNPTFYLSKFYIPSPFCIF